MKYVIAIIQPDRLDEVITALEEEESHVERNGLLHKIKVEVAVNDNDVWKAVDAIANGARTGHVGDGKIFVLDLEECLRIRTGETGLSAIR
jgi:nitrogen regulatory protein PII